MYSMHEVQAIATDVARSVVCVSVHWSRGCEKVKFSHTRYRALGPELIPVYRQSARRWFESIHPAAGCHYFPPGLRLPFQLNSVTAHRPVPICLVTEAHACEQLAQAVTWKRTSRDSNPRPLGSRANALPFNHTGHARGCTVQRNSWTDRDAVWGGGRADSWAQGTMY